MSFEPGQQLLHYRLIDKLGQGGMGIVWKAKDTKLRRRIALKVLPDAMAADPDRLARFEREARAVAALNHPNIVTLHSVEEALSSSGPVHFITMELVEGRTLTQLLPRNGFPLNRLLEIAIPLADAVSRAHRAGITHRDLKPDNIMIDDEGRLRVLDFGLAKLHDPEGSSAGTQAATVTSDTTEGQVLGTVAYMSPEQAEGKNVDARSDVFSLGTILYEMASGSRPFQGDTMMSTIGSILKDQPSSITDLNPSLPRHAGRIIRRCLAKDPDRRYQTALDLRNELEELKAEIDSGIHAAGPLGAATRPRRKVGRWILVGAVAVLGVAAIVAIVNGMRSETPATTYTSRPITSEIGQECDVTWSPESEFIAFAQVRQGSFDVMVQPVAGGEAKLRAGGPGDEACPRWAPDGKFLAYVSSSDPGTAVFLVPPHGGTPRRLIETDIPTLDIDMISTSMGDRPWSPDGKMLLVSRASESGRVEVYRVDRESGEAEQLTFPPANSADLQASRSFDGKRLVFQRRSGGRGALMTIPAGGGEPRELLADEFDNVDPSWRPDNRHVVFLSDRAGGVPNVWEIEVGTGSLRQLTFDTRSIVDVSVSSDNRIAFVPFWHDTFLYTVDVNTRETHQLTSHTNDNFGARFSPDGSSIAYHSTRTGNSEIWLHYLDGRPETQVTDRPALDLYPSWSPDGRWLVFVSNREAERYKIFIANGEGGGERLLVDQAISLKSRYGQIYSALASRWSPDGERISYLVTSDQGIDAWGVRPDGSAARQLVENVTEFDWYRDSRHAICTRPRGSGSELIAVDLESGEERSLFTGPLMEIAVAPDSGAVAFCYGRGHMAMGLAILKLEKPSTPGGLPRADGEPEYVVRTEGTWHVHNGGWSPDSRKLVYTQDRDYGDVYELVERP